MDYLEAKKRIKTAKETLKTAKANLAAMESEEAPDEKKLEQQRRTVKGAETKLRKAKEAAKMVRPPAWKRVGVQVTVLTAIAISLAAGVYLYGREDDGAGDTAGNGDDI